MLVNTQWGWQPNWVLTLMVSQIGINFVLDMAPVLEWWKGEREHLRH